MPGLTHAGTEVSPGHTPAFSRGGAAGVPRGARLDTHPTPSHVTASHPSLHHVPRVMAQVVRRAAEGAGDGTLAA